MTEPKLVHNLQHNRFWFYTALEMLALAFYFVWQNRYFEYPPPAREVLSVLDDPGPLLLIAILGAYVLIWSIWNFTYFQAKRIAIGFSMTVMVVYFLAFLLRDIDTHSLGMGTIFTGVLVLRIIHEGVTR